MIDDIIITAIERPGVFMLTYVVPVIVSLWFIAAFIELIVNLNNLRASKQARDPRAEEYWRIFTRSK